jgi:tetratricopeptide (TPR) repeat protein
VEFYADQEIPFDPVRGFDPEQAVRKDRGWAIQHGLLPIHFDQITQFAYGSDPEIASRARNFLASIYAGLGLYELAVELDRKQLDSNPDALTTRRRLVWCLLRLRRFDEAARAGEALAASPALDPLSRRIADAAEFASETTDEEALAERLARLPLFTRTEAAAITANVIGPTPRVSGTGM